MSQKNQPPLIYLKTPIKSGLYKGLEVISIIPKVKSEPCSCSGKGIKKYQEVDANGHNVKCSLCKHTFYSM